jgi:hypothetical protein
VVIPNAASYPTGAEVTVYYNPINPTEAVVEQVISLNEGMNIHFAGAAFAISVGLIILGIGGIITFLVKSC